MSNKDNLAQKENWGGLKYTQGSGGNETQVHMKIT